MNPPTFPLTDDFWSPAASAKQSAIDALDKELSKVSLAAGEAKDAAGRAVADGKKVVDTTKGKAIEKYCLVETGRPEGT